MTALAGLRILDLTDLKGAMCAKLFGDMGADVIKIEPPEGDATRRIGPFLDGKPHQRGNVSSTGHETLDTSPLSERSLLFWFYNTSKREHHSRSEPAGRPGVGQAVSSTGGRAGRVSRARDTRPARPGL